MSGSPRHNRSNALENKSRNELGLDAGPACSPLVTDSTIAAEIGLLARPATATSTATHLTSPGFGCRKTKARWTSISITAIPSPSSIDGFTFVRGCRRSCRCEPIAYRADQHLSAGSRRNDEKASFISPKTASMSLAYQRLRTITRLTLGAPVGYDRRGEGRRGGKGMAGVWESGRRSVRQL